MHKTVRRNMAAQQETHCDLPSWFCSMYIGLTQEKNASCWPKILKNAIDSSSHGYPLVPIQPQIIWMLFWWRSQAKKNEKDFLELS